MPDAAVRHTHTLFEQSDFAASIPLLIAIRRIVAAIADGAKFGERHMKPRRKAPDEQRKRAALRQGADSIHQHRPECLDMAIHRAIMTFQRCTETCDDDKR
jgi:hypothetical protein